MMMGDGRAVYRCHPVAPARRRKALGQEGQQHGDCVGDSPQCHCPPAHHRKAVAPSDTFFGIIVTLCVVSGVGAQLLGPWGASPHTCVASFARPCSFCSPWGTSSLGCSSP